MLKCSLENVLMSAYMPFFKVLRGTKASKSTYNPPVQIGVLLSVFGRGTLRSLLMNSLPFHFSKEEHKDRVQ